MHRNNSCASKRNGAAEAVVAEKHVLAQTFMGVYGGGQSYLWPKNISTVPEKNGSSNMTK